MADISRSRAVAAPSQAIWDVLADFGALSSWADDVDHSCLLNDGPDGNPHGTTRRVQVGRNTLVERIVEFDPPTALAYDIAGLPKRLGRLENRWTLRPAGATTMVTVTSRVAIGSGLVARAVEKVVTRVMAKLSTSMLAGLAQRLEDPRD